MAREFSGKIAHHQLIAKSRSPVTFELTQGPGAKATGPKGAGHHVGYQLCRKQAVVDSATRGGLDMPGSFTRRHHPLRHRATHRRLGNPFPINP